MYKIGGKHSHRHVSLILASDTTIRRSVQQSVRSLFWIQNVTRPNKFASALGQLWLHLRKGY